MTHMLKNATPATPRGYTPNVLPGREDFLLISLLLFQLTCRRYQGSKTSEKMMADGQLLGQVVRNQNL